MKFYTSGQLQDIFPGTSRKTVAVWAKMGLFEWESEERDGRGIIRFYSNFNLYQIALVRKLSGLNIPLDIILLVMDRYFLDHTNRPAIIQKLPNQSAELASKSDVMSKCLIFTEDKGQRGWAGKSCSGFTLRNFDQVGEYIARNQHLTTFVVINLPSIVNDVHASIHEAGLA